MFFNEIPCHRGDVCSECKFVWLHRWLYETEEDCISRRNLIEYVCGCGTRECHNNIHRASVAALKGN